MAGDRTAIAAGGEGRNTPAAAHVASLVIAGRASVASSLHRAARLATGSGPPGTPGPAAARGTPRPCPSAPSPAASLPRHRRR